MRQSFTFFQCFPNLKLDFALETKNLRVVIIHEAQFLVKLRLFQRVQQNSENFAIQFLRFPTDSLFEKLKISDIITDPWAALV